MKVSTSVTGKGVALIEVEGDIYAHTVHRLEETLTDLLAQDYGRLVLDASQMEYISSPGLRALLDAQREARRLGGEVRLFSPNAQVRRTFELAGVDELLYIADTREEAVEGR